MAQTPGTPRWLLGQPHSGHFINLVIWCQVLSKWIFGTMPLSSWKELYLLLQSILYSAIFLVCIFQPLAKLQAHWAEALCFLSLYYTPVRSVTWRRGKYSTISGLTALLKLYWSMNFPNIDFCNVLDTDLSTLDAPSPCTFPPAQQTVTCGSIIGRTLQMQFVQSCIREVNKEQNIIVQDPFATPLPSNQHNFVLFLIFWFCA